MIVRAWRKPLHRNSDGGYFRQEEIQRGPFLPELLDFLFSISALRAAQPSVFLPPLYRQKGNLQGFVQSSSFGRSVVTFKKGPSAQGSEEEVAYHSDGSLTPFPVALQLYRLLVTDYPGDAIGEPWR